MSASTTGQGFFAELRRRKVIRVGLAYLIVAWLLLQVAEVTFEPLKLPEWAMTLVIWLTGLGFPVALALAWAFEHSADGVRRERPVATPAQRPDDEPSIAVLPFVDMSAERDQGHFCDGMAEEILNMLTRLRDVRVASRTSAFQYKGQWVDVRTIGRDLAVATVLEGSVRKSGTRLRVTAQLIDVDTGYHVWSERYDRPLEDVFAIQDEIAGNIAAALKPRLTPVEREAIQAPATDTRAYEYYLRGLQFFHRFGRNLEYARRMFEKAIEVDAGYAPAWAGLADTMAFLYLYIQASEENRQVARDAARKAVDLAPGLAEAHASMGLTELLSKCYAAARDAFEEAIRLNPRLYEAWYFYARACVEQSEFERAAELFEEAARLRPDDYQAVALAQQTYESLGRSEAARDAASRTVKATEKTLEFNPDDARALYLGAAALYALGEHERALAWAEAALAVDPNDRSILYNVACLYARAGDAERAMDMLERVDMPAMANRSWVENDASLDSLRGHPRFEQLLARLSK